MTITLRFYDATQVPAGSCVSWSSPAKALHCAGSCCVFPHGARAKSRALRYHPRRRSGRHRLLAAFGRCCAAHGGAGDHAADRSRFRRPHGLCAGLGHPELLLHHAAAAPGAVGRAVADAGGGAGAAVAAQARRRADDRELRRPDGDRPRHRGLSVHDLPESALERGRRRARHPAADVCAVVARSVPHPPPAGRGRPAGLSGGADRAGHDLAGRRLERLLRRRLSLQIRPLGRDGDFRLRQLRLHGIGGRHRRAAEGAAGGFLSRRRPPPAHHHDP